MSTKAVTLTLALVAAASVAMGQQRVNEIAPGRGQELLKMQETPAPAPTPTPTPAPQPTNPAHNPHTRPYPYPYPEPVYPYVGYTGYGHYGYGYPYYSMYNSRYYYQQYQPVVLTPTQTVQVPQQVQTPRELTDLDYAMDALQTGRTSIAIDRFLEHLKTKADDFVAMRLIGLMYLEEKQPSEAATRIAFAYKRMPELSRRPLDIAELGIDSGRVREMVVKASKYANRMKTGSSWLMVTILMQAEGRTSFALANLAKAEAAGLDTEIVAGLRAALAPMETEQVPVAEPLKESKETPPGSGSGEQKQKQDIPKNP